MRQRYLTVLVMALCLVSAAWAAENPGPVLHLTFDEGSGATARDASPGARNGVIHGQPQWADGKAGKALLFDGKDDYVEIADIQGIDFNKSFTITAWVKSGADDDSSRTIITNVRGTEERKGFAVFDDRKLHTINVYRTTADQSNYESGLPGFFEKDLWVHMAVVADFEGNMLRIYKDGAPAAAAKRSDVRRNNWNSGKMLRIGAELRKPKAPLYFTGAIDEVRIYQRALSPAEIKAVHAEHAGTGK